MQLLRLPAVLAKTGLSRSSIYLMASKGQFPAPVKLGPRAVAWKSDAVEDFIQSRPSARAAKVGG